MATITQSNYIYSYTDNRRDRVMVYMVRPSFNSMGMAMLTRPALLIDVLVKKGAEQVCAPRHW